MLLAIKEVPPTVTPTQAAIIIKYIGKDFARAERASGKISPEALIMLREKFFLQKMCLQY